jgi:hypothetical protein
MAPVMQPLDPAEEPDRLPQPFRMIDRLLGRLLDNAVRVAQLRREERGVAASCRVERVSAWGWHAH